MLFNHEFEMKAFPQITYLGVLPCANSFVYLKFRGVAEDFCIPYFPSEFYVIYDQITD